MGLVFAVVVHAILYVILVIVLSVASWIVRRIFKPRRWWLRWGMILAPFGLAGIPFALFVVLIVWANIAPSKQVFSWVFDRPATSAIQNLHGRSRAINDSQEVFLAFSNTEAAFNEVTGSTPFQPMGSAIRRNLVPLPVAEPPSWWRADRCQDRTVYLAKDVRQWDELVLTRCPSHGAIYVQARWID